MKQIKFRAWTQDEKKMIYPTRITFAGKTSYCYVPSDDYEYQIDTENLMEYIGLKDKNQKQIYEQDWLQDDDGRKYFIVWAEDEARFELENSEDHSLRHIKDVKVMHIIGNNYEL